MDIGVREGAAVALFSKFGIASAPVFSAAFMVFVINVLIPAVVGIPFVFRIRLRKEGEG
jgi:uncharacterized membrane protein YbhN (UPF0104 family)